MECVLKKIEWAHMNIFIHIIITKKEELIWGLIKSMRKFNMNN
jgi:hypothetical protein